MSKLEQYLRRYAKTMPDSRARDLMQEAADRIAELEKDLEQSIEHIDNLQFCSEERGFFYCPNCGEGTKHTKDCYIGVFLDKHKP
jgi:hypothetical protein